MRFERNSNHFGLSSGVFSTDRILVVTRDGKRLLVAVAEKCVS